MNASNESSIFYNNADIVRITSATISLVLGVPVNGWVLWLVFTGPAGTVASDFFTLNLSACEILTSVLYLPGVIKRVHLLQNFAGAGLWFNGRSLFQCCICVERFVAVVHPVLFLKFKPLRYRAACSAVVWLLTIGFSLLYVLVVNMIFWCLYLGQCLFYIVVMLSCSLAILRALKQPMPGETGRERERDNGMKRRAFAIICLIMGSFLGANLTWCINDIFYILGLLLDYLDLLTSVCMFITVVAGFVQPLLYLCQKVGKLPCVCYC